MPKITRKIRSFKENFLSLQNLINIIAEMKDLDAALKKLIEQPTRKTLLYTLFRETYTYSRDTVCCV